MTLAETQALLHEAITAGPELAAGRIDRCVAATPALSARESVEVYADMYLGRLVEALRETFPALARHLGEETFGALAGDYLRRHPSEHHDIGQAGRRLPAFLREHPDPERPWLADLAALEWARNEVFFAAEARPIEAGALFGLGAEAFAEAHVALGPSVRILRLGHPITRLWRQLEDGGGPEPVAPEPAAVAVWRSRLRFEVHHCALALDEAEALERAARAEPLAQVCEAFAEREDPAAAAAGAIASWLAEGWVVPGGGTRGAGRDAGRHAGSVEGSTIGLNLPRASLSRRLTWPTTNDSRSASAT